MVCFHTCGCLIFYSHIHIFHGYKTYNHKLSNTTIHKYLLQCLSYETKINKTNLNIKTLICQKQQIRNNRIGQHMSNIQ